MPAAEADSVLRIATISTADFLSDTTGLRNSLERSGTDFHLTIYCDDAGPYTDFRRENCDVVELQAIADFGPLRGRFAAYTDALRNGDMLYLDSDIVVLESLNELRELTRIAGCFDDLSECDFIADRRFPWPSAPELENRIYINAGVVFAPKSAAPLFEELAALSLRDEQWERYIWPAGLYDNHFLCAHLNIFDVAVDYLDARRYNWQGFRRRGVLQVKRVGNSLINKDTGEALRLVHFAGIRDTDAFLSSLPLDVSSLIAARAGDRGTRREAAFVNFLGSFGGNNPPDESTWRAVDVIGHEMLHVSGRAFGSAALPNESYVSDPEALISLCYSKRNSGVRWNGLQCGGAYLEGDEYNCLRHWLQALSLRSVVEIGAGETSILFKRSQLSAVSIESESGEWLDRARSYGCECQLVRFDDAAGQFDEAQLALALPDANRRVDLLFIDSPVGTFRRAKVLSQLTAKVRPRFVALHDARRDAENIFCDLTRLDFRVLSYFPSVRGMLLLGNRCESVNSYRVAQDAAIDADRLRLAADRQSVNALRGTETSCRIAVENGSGHVLSSNYIHPVHVSYHWLTEDGACETFDGCRTRLPFDVHPGDTAEFPILIQAPQSAGRFVLHIALVQEAKRWFDDVPAASPKLLCQIG
jgi:hypothetical protein